MSFEFNPREGVDRQVTRNARASARAIREEDLGPQSNGLLAVRSSARAWPTTAIAWLTAGIVAGARPGKWETVY